MMESYILSHAKTWEISRDHAGPWKHLKVGEKEAIMSQFVQDKEISASGRNFNQGRGNSYHSGEISLSCIDTHDGILYSIPCKNMRNHYFDMIWYERK